jgi:hypothetical protein
MPSEPVGQEAFAVIREAMRGKRMVALGRLVPQQPNLYRPRSARSLIYAGYELRLSPLRS